MYSDLTSGNIANKLILFSLPMIAGNILQQFYNIADTLIVGKALGSNALAAVGSAFTLMTFLTSIFLGLSMGAGALFSICRGGGNEDKLKKAIAQSFLLIFGVTLTINVVVYTFVDQILGFLKIPDELYAQMREYLLIIFIGLVATFVYNFSSCLLRALGNSTVPLCFLGVSTVVNILLDLLFVLKFDWGISGAAYATVIAQYLSAVGLLIYILKKCPEFIPTRDRLAFDKHILREIIDLSLFTCLQQSAMNFGILLIQRLVDSCGADTMAAFAAAVKIDAFAYLPVQDFGNAFSTFTAQNYGANKKDRLKNGFKTAIVLSSLFSVVISGIVWIFATPLMKIFIDKTEFEIISAGVEYLRIEGAFYIGIGLLFLLYGFYRAVKRPFVSVILTVISLGTRVILAYSLIGIIGEVGIWMSVPIGWFLADAVGFAIYFLRKSDLLCPNNE